MKRRTFLNTGFITAATGMVTSGFTVDRLSGEEIPDNGLLQKLPHHIKLSWQTAPETSQSVSWRTDAQTPVSYLDFAKATASPFFTNPESDQKAQGITRIESTSKSYRADDGLWYYHSVNISGLKPGTTYTYRVGNGEYWSAWSEFTTVSIDEKPFKFLYFGDVQRFIISLGSRIIRQALLNCPDASFMVFGGDLVHRGGLNIGNWNEFFPAGGSAFQNIPMLATPGNHEHLKAASGVDLSPLWALTFCFPANGPEGQKGQTYYVDYKYLRLISLNMNLYKYPDEREKIYNWTKTVLADARSKGLWVIVTDHYNMRGLARNRGNELRFPEFKQLFEAYQVPLLLTGHEHVYGRGRMDAPFPVYVVSVAGPWQNAIKFDSWLERAGTCLQLFQVIEVEKDVLHYQSKTVLGELYDEFWIKKRGNGSLLFEANEHLGPESLLTPLNFEERYKKELVDSYEADKNAYLKRKK